MIDLIERIYKHWQKQSVKKSDHEWYGIIRSYPSVTHSLCAEQWAQLIREGYTHPKYSPIDSIKVCEQQIQACADPQWDTIMSARKDWIYQSHEYKSTQWQFWRMVCEIIEYHAPKPQHTHDEKFNQLFEAHTQ